MRVAPTPTPSPAVPPVAVFGGSFDPVHEGHLNVARQVGARTAADVVFVPAACPPHKRDCGQTAASDRLAMVRLAVRENPRFRVSAWEVERGGLSYTVDLAAHFAAVWGDRLRLVVGADSLQDLHQWYRAEELVRRYRFLVYARPGCHLPDVETLTRHFGAAAAERLLAGVVSGPTLAISSTQLRADLAAGKDVSGLLPPAVLAYIEARGLYGRGRRPNHQRRAEDNGN